MSFGNTQKGNISLLPSMKPLLSSSGGDKDTLLINSIVTDDSKERIFTKIAGGEESS